MVSPARTRDFFPRNVAFISPSSRMKVSSKSCRCFWCHFVPCFGFFVCDLVVRCGHRIHIIHSAIVIRCGAGECKAMPWPPSGHQQESHKINRPVGAGPRTKNTSRQKQRTSRRIERPNMTEAVRFISEMP